MLRPMIFMGAALSVLVGTGFAGDHYHFHASPAVYGMPMVNQSVHYRTQSYLPPAPVYQLATPNVSVYSVQSYSVPTVTYQQFQPAYVVPAGYAVVSHAPVTVVSQSSEVFAPLVPVTGHYYSPRSVVAASHYLAPQPLYGVPVIHGSSHRLPRHLRPRDVEIEIDYKRDGSYEIEVDYDR